ncbi:MAG TPA: SUMF1/EgtB/PvdO family nonheme iron enzyme, partial [Pyrinomonadaceae bacterium]|nr:SUMF1/EgtB/PvdO family nonheme iron enzyme [Pyrinomonadaceae bacterium]
VQVRGKNYLVPVDAEILREYEIEDQGVDINLIMAKMETAKTDLNIIMLDACRNNPFAKEWSKYRTMNEQDGLAKIDAPRNTVMFYAAEPGKVAWDGIGKNGTFTEALLENIKKPLELDFVIKQVKRSVQEKSKYKQAAYIESSNSNDFYFVKTADPNATHSSETVTKPAGSGSTVRERDVAAREQEAWEQTKDSANEDIFRLFLEEFPNGKYAPQARINLEQLIWDSIKTTNDLDAVERFLREFPNGANKGAARIRLQRLKAKEKTAPNEETTTAVNTGKENKAEETPTTENKAPESKTTENKTAENKVEEKNTAETKSAENKPAENNPVENRATGEPKKEIVTAPAPPLSGKSRFQREAEGWDAVKNSMEAQQIRGFLTEFPDGLNAQKAKIRLEQVLWDERRVKKDKSLLAEHLKEFPDGANAPLARLLLLLLEAPEKYKPGEETPSASNRGVKAKIPVRANVAGMEFVLIPAGSFMMGASAANIAQSLSVARKDYADFDQTQLNNEKPARRVTISEDFWMGKFEVTQAQWAAVMGENPSWFKGCDNCPVERVSWEMAKIFLQRLNELDDGFVYRLPSEAEWEYGARAGTAGIFSGPVEQMSWNSANSGDKTHPVGEKLPNPFGLYDIYGNVSEWCEDVYSPTYEGLPVDGAPNTSVGNNKQRVLRGGAWSVFPTKSRSTFRESYPANAFGTHIGFRVVAVPKK